MYLLAPASSSTSLLLFTKESAQAFIVCTLTTWRFPKKTFASIFCA
jgi:hypothetical protein